MESQQNNQSLPEVTQTTEPWYAPLNRVTTVSKILAATVFITLPFVGFWLGMGYGESQNNTVIVSSVAQKDPSATTTAIADQDERTFAITRFDSKKYVEESFLSESLLNNYRGTNFLEIGTKCDFFGGLDCTVTVPSGASLPFGLKPGVLNSDTGPYKASANHILTDVRALGDGKLLLVWSFGDGGGISYQNSMWDTHTGTHIFVSSWGGLQGELMSIRISDQVGEKKFSILDNTSGGNTDGEIDVFDENMFAPQSNREGGGTRYCVSVVPTPKDRINPKAPWLLEYSYTCPGPSADTYRYYELDPVSGKIVPFVVP